jgi:hypothetical protein
LAKQKYFANFPRSVRYAGMQQSCIPSENLRKSVKSALSACLPFAIFLPMAQQIKKKRIFAEIF